MIVSSDHHNYEESFKTQSFSDDNKVCADVARNPTEYLVSYEIIHCSLSQANTDFNDTEHTKVPHPTDCTKFYSCQRLGWGGGNQNHHQDDDWLGDRIMIMITSIIIRAGKHS